MATPQQHIEEIRKTKFSIGGDANPLIEDLHQATKHLSAELYTKDVHFFMELIQNAEDNEYVEGVDPSLEFVITSSDITRTGAPATLLVFNNEKGFSSKNVESLCSVGRSTKKGNRKRGFIGEKGIGFKSVFLITSQPYIFSNGYQIRFTENPCSHCGLGYIVPEWVEENPSLLDIEKVYGSGSTLPTTTLILPLKPDKIKAVKDQLSTVHPEVLLFLSKIKSLSVREVNKNPKLNTVCAIAITSETNFVTRKNIDAESYTIHLSAKENAKNTENECSYYMWKQKFPVKSENRVDRRMEVEEWAITLAFPNQERLSRGMSSPGVYAFLPTEMVTDLPFIIQADFLLASSRETILFDDKWNQGILDCVPVAFINAFIALVKMIDNAPVSSLARMFKFLPVKISASYPKLNVVRDTIKARLSEESIVPGESYTEQKFFHRPCEVGRLNPNFWNILAKARKHGINLQNLSSHGCYILNSSFDTIELDEVLAFLEVKFVNDEWYAKCIRSSNLVPSLSEGIYIELLSFVADNWSNFHSTSIKNIPLLRCVGLNEDVSLCSISDCLQSSRQLCLSQYAGRASWLIESNRQFGCAGNYFFMPKSFHDAVNQIHGIKEKLLAWLKDSVGIAVVDVYDYAKSSIDNLNGVRNLAVDYAHFLYHSYNKGFLSEAQVSNLCRLMPLVDNYGYVRTKRNGTLVPSNGSQWAKLISSNPWREEGYIELGEDYTTQRNFAGNITLKQELLPFLEKYVGASDIPMLSPPGAGIHSFTDPLTKGNAFLLLSWIQSLRKRKVAIPDKFLQSMKEGSWLRIQMNGSPGYKPPSKSFHLASTWGNLLQNGSVFVDIPLLDESFYGERINQYKEELRFIGVVLDYKQALEFIGNHLMTLADSSNLTRDKVISILRFIKFLKGNSLPPEEFIRSIKAGNWMKTSQGYRSPVGSVLFDNKWVTASQISNLPFIDQDYYGSEIGCFKMELCSLGVIVDYNQDHRLLVNHLKSSTFLSSLSADAIILLLECIYHSDSPGKVIEAVKNAQCLKTNAGFKSPGLGECFLLDPEWGCLLRVFNNFAILDHQFYGSRVLMWKNELKKIGVVVDFEDAAKAFARVFKKQASSSTITKENAFSFLSCYRLLKKTPHKFPSDLKSCIRDVEWLQTRAGFKSPKDCVLSGSAWEPIAPIARIPFINDNFYGTRIYEFEKELKKLGVVVDVKGGLKFVFNGLSLPRDPSCITKQSIFSLLDCIQMFLQENNNCLPSGFVQKLSLKWLKTNVGYKTPDNCLLFDTKWTKYLKLADGPFLDEGFYGSEIVSYRDELNAMGVIVTVKEGCPLVAKYISVHCDFTTIVRIYKFLNHCNWEPDTDDAKIIWIPEESNDGRWVYATNCVLYDKHDLFGTKFEILEKHYESELLPFFGKAFNVKSNPSLDDYCELWKEWEKSGHRLSETESLAFWGCIIRHTSGKSVKTITDSMSKLPVMSDSKTTLLVDKLDVFIGDDLQLKELFDQNSPHPIFVWYPQPSLPSLPRTQLLEIYSKIGARKISEVVQKEELSALDNSELKQVNSIMIKKGLVKVILGFLSSAPLNMEAKERHAAVQRLLNLTVLETQEPGFVSYSLSLSSGEVVNAKARKMIWWDKKGSKLFVQKIDKDAEQRELIEYAANFSNEISKGLLWDKEDHISSFAVLIKLGFLLHFDEAAMDFLMKLKNLQIFMEDVEFLSTAFPSN